MAHEPSAFGAALRRLRTAAALSQEALADRAGLSVRAVSDLERGVRRAPHLATVGMLADALGLDPDERQVLLAAARPNTVAETRPAPPDRSARIPVPLTSLIGRESEVITLAALLTDGVTRLVTVTGPGGSGKTRLALEVGVRLQAGFADGVVFVDLAPLADDALVIPTIANALGVRERADQRLLDTLSGVLATMQAVLLIDNCEQVLGAAPEIAELLAASPRMAILATSREPLRIRSERVFPLSPLSLPPGDPLPALEDLAQVPAVALFVERAQAADPGFALTEENAAAVAAICHRLDGLPLAIELAAARAPLLPAATLLTRLERRLLLLTGGARDLPARQRTLRDAIAWSHDLLTAEEQVLFRCLGVFVGGFGLEAAERAAGDVAGDAPAPGFPASEDLSVLDTLAGLVSKSLLRPVPAPGSDSRFAMLETVREFALERLEVSGSASAVRGTHADYYLALVEEAAPFLWGHDQLVWLARLEAEHDNLRAALTWLQDQATGAERVGRLALALSWFWYLHGHMSEGRRWLAGFLTGESGACSELSPLARARALVGAGFLSYGGGDLVGAASLLEEGRDLARWADDPPALVRAIDFLGFTLRDQGHYVRAEELFDEGLAVARASGDRWAIGFSTYLQSTLAQDVGDLERQARLAEESLPLLREQGERLGLAYVLNATGDVGLREHDHARAAAAFGESLALSRDLGNLRGIGFALVGLGVVARRRGDNTAAARYFVESLAPWLRLGNHRGVADALEELAETAAACGEAVRAARLSGAAFALRETIGQPRSPRLQAEHDRGLQAARAVLGEQAFVAAWQAGHDLALENALAEGRNLAEALKFGSDAPAGPPGEWPFPLSPAIAGTRGSPAKRPRARPAGRGSADRPRPHGTRPAAPGNARPGR